MKKVITGKELQETMENAITLLCGTVKQTLGPKGYNVLIDSSDLSPYITNDGVTIAKNIESDQKGVDTILEIAKEASIKTNEMVGDGTTTTLVLLESLFLNSLEDIKKGTHPMILKKELNKSLEEIIKRITKIKQKPSKKMLRHIATISASDEELGSLAYDAFQIVADKSSIIIEEKEEKETSLSHLQGYYLETSLASNYLLQNQTKLELNDAYLLILENGQIDLEAISMLLNEVISQKNPLIIIADNFDEYFVQAFTSLVMDKKLNGCLLKLEEYGMNSRMIKEDLEVISGAKIIKNENEISSFSVGHLSHIYITSEYTRITVQSNDKLKKYVSKLQNVLETELEDFKQDFYKRRIAMFTHGIVKINISAPTKTECREKRMRLEDALCAVSTSKNGILPGSGITLYQIAEELTNDNLGNKIWKISLMKPLEQILWNAGIEAKDIIEQMKKRDYQILYNVSTNQFELIENTKVVDPYEVVISSLKHACSIATMLLTTTSLVINEKEKNVYLNAKELEL